MRGKGSEEKHYTYTIITTDSNKQLRFLHDRMPVILDPGSEELKTWLDPGRHEWTRELQSLLKPFEGELDVYPVSKEVGKVGNNSPSFIIPIDSKENKSNIANFFVNAKGKPKTSQDTKTIKEETEVKVKSATKEQPKVETAPDAIKEENEEMEVKENQAVKREAPTSSGEKSPPAKRQHVDTTPTKGMVGASKTISATQNTARSPKKAAQPGAQKITKFFNSA